MSHGYAGYDPYDALRSPFLDRVHTVLGRPFGIAATQLLRRSPWNLRGALGVTPAVNPKGLALLLSAAALTGMQAEARALADRLRALRSRGWDTPCWGYPFPWRARAFYLPAGTPTVVATSFAGEAFLDAHALTGDPIYLDHALSACRFVLEKLHRTEDETGACLSYSPLDRSAVYNASVLGAKLLVGAAGAAKRPDLSREAEPLVRFVVARQRPDGSWPYGEASYHGWADSFHTGFVLGALDRFAVAMGDRATETAVARGLSFYATRFFGPSGEPYYFANRRYPYDIHSAAQALITLTQLRRLDPTIDDLRRKVSRFMVDRFLAPDGHFRYQIRRTHVVSIPYMRWSQAWGIRGLAAMISANP